MIKHRVETPKISDALFGNFGTTFKAIDIPDIVDNSAKAFMEEPMKSPLRERIAVNATIDVKIPELKSKRRRDKTMGMPVKSNFRIGSQGNGIFRPEYFIV